MSDVSIMVFTTSLYIICHIPFTSQQQVASIELENKNKCHGIGQHGIVLKWQRHCVSMATMYACMYAHVHVVSAHGSASTNQHKNNVNRPCNIHIAMQ